MLRALGNTYYDWQEYKKFMTSTINLSRHKYKWIELILNKKICSFQDNVYSMVMFDEHTQYKFAECPEVHYTNM